MSGKSIDFIVVDDSKLDCFIAEKLIKNAGVTNVRSFTDAREALQVIGESNKPTEAKTILLVDVQMPMMNGFEFMEAFEKLPATTQGKYIVYVLSSSSNENDINKMKGFKAVTRYLNKPLSMQMLAGLLQSHA